MRSRVKTDKGNAVVIWGIFILIMILVCAVLIVDLAKAMYVKNVYSSYARKAVQTAVKEQDYVGGLKFESAQKVIDEYMIQRNGGKNTREAAAFSSNCDKTGKYPIIEIRYDNKRAKDAISPVYTSVNGSKVSIPKLNDFFKSQYNTIEVNITDVTDNYFMGIFGVPCGEIHIRASGITAASSDDDDLKINKTVEKNNGK